MTPRSWTAEGSWFDVGALPGRTQRGGNVNEDVIPLGHDRTAPWENPVLPMPTLVTNADGTDTMMMVDAPPTPGWIGGPCRRRRQAARPTAMRGVRPLPPPTPPDAPSAP